MHDSKPKKPVKKPLNIPEPRARKAANNSFCEAIAPHAAALEIAVENARKLQSDIPKNVDVILRNYPKLGDFLEDTRTAVARLITHLPTLTVDLKQSEAIEHLKVVDGDLRNLEQ